MRLPFESETAKRFDEDIFETIDVAAPGCNNHAQFLKNCIEDRLSQLKLYMDKIREGLGSNSPVDNPEDAGELYDARKHISDVKVSLNAVRKLFKPIHDLCPLLKKHHVTVDGLPDLELAPSKWDEVHRLAFDEKLKLLPLQNDEQLKFRDKTGDFAETVSDFRANFRLHCPFDQKNAISEEFDKSYKVINGTTRRRWASRPRLTRTTSWSSYSTCKSRSTRSSRTPWRSWSS